MLLSVLDILSPTHLPTLVRQLDRLGYHRYWATEHHSLTQSASPTVVTSLAAAMTARMRVGTAGILLNYASAAKVAEDFRLLELYFPGRIDLGVTGAAIAQDDLYLDGRPQPSRESFAARVRALVDLVRGDHQLVIGPACPTRPELWLCGSSLASAVLAGELGMRFACHRPNAGSSEAARVAITAYRDAYRGAGSPYSTIAVYGACASTEPAAQQLWPVAAGSPCFVGAPGGCVEQLHTLVSDCSADEATIHLHVLDIDARITGYRLLAEAAGLQIDPDEDVAADVL